MIQRLVGRINALTRQINANNQAIAGLNKLNPTKALRKSKAAGRRQIGRDGVVPPAITKSPPSPRWRRRKRKLPTFSRRFRRNRPRAAILKSSAESPLPRPSSYFSKPTA